MKFDFIDQANKSSPYLAFAISWVLAKAVILRGKIVPSAAASVLTL